MAAPAAQGSFRFHPGNRRRVEAGLIGVADANGDSKWLHLRCGRGSHHNEHRIQGRFKRSSQQVEKGNCDGYSKAPFRSMRASTIAVAGPTAGSTAGELSAILGSDCGRPFNRGRCSRRRSVARSGWPVVPEGGRDDTGPLFTVFEASVGPLSIVCRARRDCHIAGSGARRSRNCPQTWASTFDDLTRTAPECRNTQRRTGISSHHRAMACRSFVAPSQTSQAGRE